MTRYFGHTPYVIYNGTARSSLGVAVQRPQQPGRCPLSSHRPGMTTGHDMPTRPKHPCNHPGCPTLVSGGAYCPAHAKQRLAEYERRRGSSTQRGYDRRWGQYRAAYLAAHPLCVRCEATGIITPATVVDHITPHKGNRDLFWDTTNHQALCKACHDRKTATEDGRWGESRTR